MRAGLVSNVQMPVNSDDGTTCPEGQLTVPQSRLAVRLPGDILEPESKRLRENAKNSWPNKRIGLEYLA
jgi:hypothetical protein